MLSPISKDYGPLKMRKWTEIERTEGKGQSPGGVAAKSPIINRVEGLEQCFMFAESSEK